MYWEGEYQVIFLQTSLSQEKEGIACKVRGSHLLKIARHNMVPYFPSQQESHLDAPLSRVNDIAHLNLTDQNHCSNLVILYW